MSQKWFNNIDLQQNELQNGVIQNLAGDPSNGKAGQIYYNTTDKGYRYHNGTAWVGITAEAVKSIIAGNGLTSSGTDTVTISLGTPSTSGSGSNTYGSNGTTTSSHTHQISLPDASTSAKGVIGIASQTEVNEGANIAKAVTPGTLAKGKSGGVASLDANGKILLSQIPDSIYGNVLYGGNLTAFTEDDTFATVAISGQLRQRLKLATGDTTITIINASSSVAALTYGYEQLEGIYFICEAAGSWGLTGNFEVGDWMISTGTSWQKVDNTDAVKSVNGKTGAVVLTYTDVDAVTTKDVQQDILGNKTFKSSVTNGPAIGMYNGRISVRSGSASGGGIIWSTPSDDIAASFDVDENGAHLSLGVDAAADILLNENAGTKGQVLMSQGANATPIWSDTIGNADKVGHALTLGAFPINLATDNSFDGSAVAALRFAAPLAVTKNGSTTTISLSGLPQKVVTTITGDGTTTDFTVANTLGADVIVQVYLRGSTIGRRTADELVCVDTYVEDTLATHLIHIVFATAPTTSQTFKVVVIG